jgi:uncharacterized membrane protein
MRDNRIRSIVKTISWRATATITTIVMVFLFTGSIALSVGIGATEVVVKLIIYYLHERLWNMTNWGKTDEI